MVQQLWAGTGPGAKLIELPHQDEEVLPGVRWGYAGSFNTPAYWSARCKWQDHNPDYVTGRSLLYETTFCLLGGYGITYEINCAAADRFEDRGFFNESWSGSEGDLRAWLLEPLDLNGRPIRYRFPNQKAKRVAGMRNIIANLDVRSQSLADLRLRLQSIDGIGPKTAAWIIRNCLGSDEVAIIDVHLIRACQQMELFPARFSLPRDYPVLEERFLRFAAAIDVRASVLDAVMWTEARRSPGLLESR